MLIPLEFHRGLGEKCLAGWAGGQTWNSESFEIILAAPADFSSEELTSLRHLLRPWDRVMVVPANHDMDLVATAAREAAGEVLIFTESHCLPEPDFLEQCVRVLSNHPQWAAFSGQSVPITHNLLSEIEAAMYTADIAAALLHHPWRKVLDQCFVIRREAYLRCGGVEPLYGHFAEWVLAGRLRENGFQVGFASEARVQHYYIGDLAELVEFAEDFGAGQLRFVAMQAASGQTSWFDSPSQWENRFAFVRHEALKMLPLKHVGGPRDRETDQARRARHRSWLYRALVGMWAQRRACSHAVKRLTQRTQHALRMGDASEARASYLALNEVAAELGQLRALTALGKSAFGGPPSTARRSGKWTPGELGSVRLVGFHGCSEYFGRRFVWSAPEASMWLPLGAGDYEVTLSWFDLPVVRELKAVCFYVDGVSAKPSEVIATRGQADFRICVVSDDRGVRIGWTCPEVMSPGDTRALGLPIRRAGWKRISRKQATLTASPTSAPA